MSDLYFTVREIGPRFIDPITQQLIQSVMYQLGLWDYFRYGVYIDNQRMAVSADDDGEGNMRMGNNRLDVGVETHYNPNDQMWYQPMSYNLPAYGTSKTWRKNKETIFADPAVGVSVQEFTAPFGLTMNFKLTFKSYDSAQVALDRIMTFAHGDVVNQTHDIEYTYPVDLSFMAVLNQVWRARASLNKKYSFYQYTNMMARAKFGFEVNRYDIGQPKPRSEYVVKKRQIGCLALMQCDQDSPTPVMQDSVPDAYTIEFTYKFQSGRPQTLQVEIPILVEQTPLPAVLFNKPTQTWCDTIVGSMQNSTFDKVIRSFSDFRNGDLFLLRFPEYDTFTPPRGTMLDVNKFNPLLIGVTPVDVTEPNVVDLNELYDVELAAPVKDLLSQHTAEDLFGYGGVFNLSVYSNNIQLDPSMMDFDPTTLRLTFKATRPLNTYRMVLSEAMTVRTLDPKWLDVILKYRYFFPMTIFRSLKFLTDMGYYTVQSDNKLINLIDRLTQYGRLDEVLKDMVNAKKTTGQIFQFTQTSTQLADYMSNTQAQLNPAVDTKDDRLAYTVFDVFCDTCIAKGFITADQRPPKYLLTPKGYPHGAQQGGFYAFNAPLRIINTTIEAVSSGRNGKS